MYKIDGIDEIKGLTGKLNPMYTWDTGKGTLLLLLKFQLMDTSPASFDYKKTTDIINLLEKHLETFSVKIDPESELRTFPLGPELVGNGLGYSYEATFKGTKEQKKKAEIWLKSEPVRTAIHYILEDEGNFKLEFMRDIILDYVNKAELIKEQREKVKRLEDETKELKKELKRVKQGDKKTGKYKRSGHLTDQMLKYTYPKDTNGQPSLFDSLEDSTKKTIETIGGVEITEIVEGIKLSPSETKVIDCLCKLLHENSQTFEPKNEDYYSGNKGFELVEFGGEKNTPAPKLSFTLYELTKEYKAGEYVGGKDIDNIKQILTGLDNKKFLLSYSETTKTKGGGRLVNKIEDFRKLIHIVKISQTEFNKEDIELSKLEETIVVLNPIFRRQIDSKFILYPNDINKRTIIAYGSHNLSDIALRLRDYLIRELSSKHFNPEINLDKLFYLLAEKWMRESRKAKVKQYTEKALETVKTLGLIETYEIKKGATGEPKIVFTLNKDWD